MKLNRKGYMAIEIILAAVLTFVIAFFLIDLTMKLSNNTDDAYADTVLITDKALIIKNIKEKLESDICTYGVINNILCNNNNCEIELYDGTVVNLSIVGNKVEYVGNEIYSKNIDSRLSDLKLITSNSNGYYNFKITGTNIFIDDNYDINILVYNECK